VPAALQVVAGYKRLALCKPRVAQVTGGTAAARQPTAGNLATEDISASPVKGFQPATDQEERSGHLPEPTRRLPMAVERYHMVTRDSLRATCPNATAPSGRYLWRITAKPTG
jgi:hypothetical protein